MRSLLFFLHLNLAASLAIVQLDLDDEPVLKRVTFNYSDFMELKGAQYFSMKETTLSARSPSTPLVFWEGVDYWNVSSTYHEFKKYNRYPCCPHSFPFVTGDLFRMFADVVIDRDSQLGLNFITETIKGVVNRAVIVFIKTDFVEAFESSILPAIVNARKNAVIITHNSDYLLSRLSIEVLQHPAVLAVFAENCDVCHPKVICLPLGVENYRYRVGAQVELLLEKMDTAWAHRIRRSLNPIKELSALEAIGEPFVFANFRLSTHSSRALAWEALRQNSLVYMQQPDDSGEQGRFWADVSTFPLTATPRGRGMDTHRFWEAVYLGSIPIVTKEEPFTTALMQLDVPLIVLSSWSNLTKDAVTEQLAAWVKSHSPVNGTQCVAAGTCWWRPSNKIFAPFWLCAISKAALVPASRNWCTLERIRTFMQSMKT